MSDARATPGAGCGSGCGCGERASWRSLEELAGSSPPPPGEFAPGADLPPEGIDRRSLVQLLGATLSLAGLAACRRPVQEIVPFVTLPEDTVPGVAKRYATTMPLGTAAWGLLVTSREGRPVKIEGNELHPANRGAASALQQAAILGLYDPDRSRHPTRRAAGEAAAGGEGAERSAVEPKSWSDFVAAWKELEPAHLADGGASLAILAPASSSPTRARLAAAARQRFPALRWATWEPVGDGNALAGAALLAGRPLRASHDLAAARVVLALDADLLLGESESVANARGLAAGRRPAGPGDGMTRLWAVESALTTTGAMADHRLALPSGRIGAFVVALARALAAQGVALDLPPGPAESPAGVDAAWLRALASDLAANRGRGAIVAGRDQPPAVHALALALDAALGNLGATVFLREPLDVAASSPAELAELAAALGRGEVSTLVVLGGNPAYDAPAELGLAAALARVPHLVHLGAAADETAALAEWHLNEAHFLEAWGDARAADGTPSVIQPLIEPLWGGKSALELLRLVATGEEQGGLDLVRESWTAILPEGADPMLFDAAFRRVLHDGLAAGGAPPPVALEAARPIAELAGHLPAEAAGGDGALEVVFRGSPAVHDGRFANVGWLQELPDAISKLTWGNAALLAPATARRLGIGNEEVVRLRLEGAPPVELPAWIVPGQAEETVVVHLGYGRRAAGRVGSGVGADVYPLRRSGALGFAAGARLEPAGRRQPLAQTQEHGGSEDRAPAREATLAAWRREPRFASAGAGPPAPATGAAGEPQWAMTIDLGACTGCNACVVACQSENNVPVVGAEQVRRGREMHWLRIDRYFSGRSETPGVAFQPVPCMHCEEAPCERVCPVAATLHTSDGLNAMVYNRCVGARSCSSDCPYKVRRFNFFDYGRETPEVLALAANPEVTVRSRGVMEKCTYCVQRIQAARIEAKLAGRPLADGEVRTACQQTCPAEAIVFGDAADAASRVHARRASERGYALLAERGTRPRTTYLARIRNPHPELEAS